MLYVGCTILDSLVGGTIAFATTKLTADLAEDGNTAYVKSVNNFPDFMALGNVGQDYVVGTATFTQDSVLVVGIGTAWTEAMDGSSIKLNADDWDHIVSLVLDTTHLRLTYNYKDTGGTGPYTMAPRLVNYLGLFIENEYVGYTSKTAGVNPSFNNLQRGQAYGTSLTLAVEHTENAPVMSEESSNLNSLIGFKVITTQTIWGKMFAVGDFVWSWMKAIPKFLLWDYDFLNTVAIVKPFLWAMSVGFVLVLALYVKRLLNPLSN